MTTQAIQKAVRFTGDNSHQLMELKGVVRVCMPFETMARVFTDDPHKHIDVNIGDWLAESDDGPVVVYQHSR